MFDTSEFIRDYLTQKFNGKFKISASGKELTANSPFEEDTHHKFSININTGLWQDFKSHTKGNFTQLYSFLEGKPYRQSQIDITLGSIRKVEKSSYVAPVIEATHDLQEVVKTFIPITIYSGEDEDPAVRKAWTYLFGRCLFDLENPTQTYFYCKEGEFADRVIIPFMNRGKVVFFQGRSLSEQHWPKYLTPETTYGIKSSDVLYPFDVTQNYVVVCEGPIDAVSLQLEGVNATATMGSYPSAIQTTTLGKWGGKVICGYDNDEAGTKGLRRMSAQRKNMCLPGISYVFPSKEHKDWNAMRMAEVNCQEYIQKNSKVFDAWSFDIALNTSSL